MVSKFEVWNSLTEPERVIVRGGAVALVSKTDVVSEEEIVSKTDVVSEEAIDSNGLVFASSPPPSMYGR
jgi:hypothetical protein